MRLVALLTLALFSGSVLAVSGSLHKCQSKGGGVYYTDKACSIKNERDKKPLLDKDGKAIPQDAAPPPKKKAAKP